MTKLQIKELDRLYQEKGLEMYDYQSMLGGRAELMHHHLQGRGNAIRWYFPCGVPLVSWQHNDVHLGNRKGESLKEYYIIAMERKWGEDWLEKLERRKHTAVKVDYKKVKDYLNGKTKDYI